MVMYGDGAVRGDLERRIKQCDAPPRWSFRNYAMTVIPLVMITGFTVPFHVRFLIWLCVSGLLCMEEQAGRVVCSAVIEAA